MHERAYEILASGVLVLLSTLSGFLLQSLLQARREFKKSVIEFRISFYSELATKIESFRACVDCSRSGLTSDIERPDLRTTTILKVHPEINREELLKRLSELRLAIAKVLLVASTDLVARISWIQDVATELETQIARKPDLSQIEMRGDDVWNLFTTFGLEEAILTMRIELGIAVPVDWERAEHKVT